MSLPLTSAPGDAVVSAPSGNSSADNVAKAEMPHVGVVGLGRMGEAFAKNVIADGCRVTVCDPSEPRSALLAAAGAEVVTNLSGLSACQIVLTSLPNDEILSDVTLKTGGLVETLAPGAIHVSMSTVSPGLARRLSEQHERAGQGYVSAPVLGNPDLARARKLFLISSGQGEPLTKVTPLLERLGQRLFILGDDPGAANLMKLAGNVMTALTLESMGEVLALLRKNGISAGTGFDVLTNSLFDGKVHKAYGGKIVEGRYDPPGMAAPLAVKDLRLALAEAENSSVPMPATSLVHDRLVAMVARGWTGLDWSALGLLAACDAGLETEE